MVGSPVASIHSLTPDQPIASTSNSPPALASLGDLPPIPSTSGLGHVGEHGQTHGKHVPLEEPEVEPIDEQEDGDELEDEEDEEEVTDSSTEPEASRPQSSSGLVEREQPDEAPPDTGTSSEEEGSDSESEDDDDEEEEPTLKYSRLGGGTTEILTKDTASALAVSKQYIAMGTHNGAIFILDFDGNVVKRFRPHLATINDLSIDTASEFVASASMDGKVAIQSLTTASETCVFDLRRPMRCIALEPNFGKRSTRQFVSGGMAGNLILHEKGWLGHKEVTLHSGEGPIWAAEWSGTLIAWANDEGVRIYDTSSSTRITYISRPENSPRADLFKCTLHWSSPTTLLIAWADYIKVCGVKERDSKRSLSTVGIRQTELFVEVEAIFQVDCMISGIAPHGDEGYLILAYLTEEDDEDDDAQDQRRKAGSRPELRVISKDGEELSSDALTLRNYARFACRDYSLCPAPIGDSFYVISPQDIVVARPRDEEDHIAWLIEMKRYEEALAALEKLGGDGKTRGAFDVTEVGRKYLEFLVDDGQYLKAAQTCPKILGINAKLWEDWVFLFADKGEIKTIIPFVPTHDPQLSRLVYEMILAHFLRHDHDALLQTIKTWPHDIYDVSAVILAIQGQIERTPKSTVLMESVAELYLLNRQPGRALPYFLKLRRPGVFSLIREHNLFTDVQDQALLLVEFDQDIQLQRSRDAKTAPGLKGEKSGPERGGAEKHGTAIELLVDHTHSIPIPRVVSQLQSHRQYLFLYLDALFDKDPHLAFDYSDLQVDLYAEYNPNKLMDFLRASNYYSLERAYKICDARDLVPEMVFLLGRMGDNKRALNLIIERLGDVQRAIEFAKEQNDNDLWEDLLKYSETKPRFIRGLLENVGAEIDPIRLIRRIKNGLEIPGLKMALIKILQDFNLQISLMEGCKTILYSDCRILALKLHDGQTNGLLWTGETADKETGEVIYPQLGGGPTPATLPFGIRYLCGHTYSSTSLYPALELPPSLTKRDNLLAASLLADGISMDSEGARAKAMNAKMRFAADLRSRDTSRGRGEAAGGCPECGKAVRV